jgi:hypothetical protein
VTGEAEAKTICSALAALAGAHPVVTHIDTVIASAAAEAPRASVLELAPGSLLGSFAVNSLAPVLLPQAAWPFLRKADNPKFVLIGSVAGSVAGVEQTGDGQTQHMERARPLLITRSGNCVTKWTAH